MKQTFTIEEIKTWLSQVDSLGDALYFCSAEAIVKANQPAEEDGIDL